MQKQTTTTKKREANLSWLHLYSFCWKICTCICFNKLVKGDQDRHISSSAAYNAFKATKEVFQGLYRTIFHVKSWTLESLTLWIRLGGYCWSAVLSYSVSFSVTGTLRLTVWAWSAVLLSLPVTASGRIIWPSAMVRGFLWTWQTTLSKEKKKCPHGLFSAYCCNSMCLV